LATKEKNQIVTNPKTIRPLGVGLGIIESTNTAVLHVNELLAEGYSKQLNLDKLVEQRERQMEKGMLETGMSAP
jgi:hypothetical protein